MSGFFLELFTEEIPAGLQSSARNDLSKNLKLFFNEQKIKYDINTKIVSTPNRLIIKTAGSIKKYPVIFSECLLINLLIYKNFIIDINITIIKW